MSEHQQTIDDAKRYTDLVTAGGWKDPDVDPIKMLADVLEAHEVIVSEAEDAIRDEKGKEHEKEIKNYSEALRDVLREIGILYDDDDLDSLIKVLGEQYRARVRAEVEAAEGKAEEAERARIELEEKLATVKHELLHAQNLAKHATGVDLRKTPNKSSPTRKRAVNGRGAGPPRRKR